MRFIRLLPLTPMKLSKENMGPWNIVAVRGYAVDAAVLCSEMDQKEKATEKGFVEIHPLKKGFYYLKTYTQTGTRKKGIPSKIEYKIAEEVEDLIDESDPVDFYLYKE